AALFLKDYRVFQRYSLPCAFVGLPLACVVYQNSSHKLRSHSEKVRPILPVWIFLIYKSQICFVNKGGRLQRVTLAFFSEMTHRESSEFLVNQGREIIEGLLITVGPLHQQLRHVVGCSHGLKTPAQCCGNCTLVRPAAFLPGFLKKNDRPDDRFWGWA